ncbi:hypothetical protein DNH61_24340 [Paenibacillus sambharensis]|uniref:Metal-dependent hydrolase n=1 Tax=Paenibacillus sambharensis TaxID=1803190 RepID=A0A2W1L2P9_9BACL|nr:metal-dependent hydrolase [Paenibacillus sambharensis]PZD93179.1 hypothetical protein DNH61_24340 [Paenibacillus sambharensis]
MELLSHAAVGAIASTAFYAKKSATRKEYIQIMLSGSIIGVSPDLTKYFGDLYGHSLIMLPLAGVIFGLPLKAWKWGFSFSYLWITSAVILLLSHLLLDYAHNGIALLYPFSQEEYKLDLIHRGDPFIWFTCILVLCFVLLFRLSKLSRLTIIFISTFVLFKLLCLQYTMTRIQDDSNIKQVLISPSYLNWNYSKETSYFTTIGTYNWFGLGQDTIIQRWFVNPNKELQLVLFETNYDGYDYVLTKENGCESNCSMLVYRKAKSRWVKIQNDAIEEVIEALYLQAKE